MCTAPTSVSRISIQTRLETTLADISGSFFGHLYALTRERMYIVHVFEYYVVIASLESVVDGGYLVLGSCANL